MIKSDKWIRSQCMDSYGVLLDKPMIEPFAGSQVRVKRVRNYDIEEWDEVPALSWGTSSYGYDARCGDEFKIFTNINSSIVDPKEFSDKNFVSVKANEILIPPNSFALARTIEYFRIPEDCMVICLGKSTYARCGVIVNVTPLEAGWEGHVTLEFSNTTPLPAKIYAGEGVAQFLFFQSDERCEVSYKDRNGKYQGQTGITLPKV
jgi:dCTP deaminase